MAPWPRAPQPQGDACTYLLSFPGRPHSQLPLPPPAAELLVDREKNTEHSLLRLHAEVRERSSLVSCRSKRGPGGRRCSALCTGPRLAARGLLLSTWLHATRSHQPALPVFQRNINSTIQCSSERWCTLGRQTPRTNFCSLC